MDGTQAYLVSSSYQLFSSQLEVLVDRFYQRLFEEAPGIRGLFPADTTKLRGHFAASIAIMARNPGQVTVMSKSLRDLGQRHAAYGATEDLYPVVVKVLLATLAESAGEAWTPVLAGAWTTLVTTVASEMMAGARFGAATGFATRSGVVPK